MVGFYCVYNGAEGLRRSAKTAHTAAVTVAKALEAMDYKLAAKNFFDTLEVEAEAASYSRWRSNAASTSSILRRIGFVSRSTT